MVSNCLASFLEHTIHFRDLCARHQTHHYKLPKESEGASRHPLSHTLCLANHRQPSSSSVFPPNRRIRTATLARRDALHQRWTAGLEVLANGEVPKTLAAQRTHLSPVPRPPQRGFHGSQVLGRAPSIRRGHPRMAAITGRATDPGFY